MAVTPTNNAPITEPRGNTPRGLASVQTDRGFVQVLKRHRGQPMTQQCSLLLFEKISGLTCHYRAPNLRRNLVPPRLPGPTPRPAASGHPALPSPRDGLMPSLFHLRPLRTHTHFADPGTSPCFDTPQLQAARRCPSASARLRLSLRPSPHHRLRPPA